VCNVLSKDESELCGSISKKGGVSHDQTSLQIRGDQIRRDLSNVLSLMKSCVAGWGLGDGAIIEPEAMCQGVVRV